MGSENMARENIGLKKLKEHPHGIDLGPLRSTLPERLYTRNGKINLAPALYLNDLPRLAEGFEITPDDSFLLIGRRDLRSNNSWMHNSKRLVKGPSRCTMIMHEADANRLGIVDGASVTVKSDAGEITLFAEIGQHIMPGVVSIPHGWGHGRENTRQSVASQHAGVSINDIVQDDQTDRLSVTSVLNGQTVTVSANREV